MGQQIVKHVITEPASNDSGLSETEKVPISLWGTFSPEYAINKHASLNGSRPGDFLTTFLLSGGLVIFFLLGFEEALFFMMGTACFGRFAPAETVNKACGGIAYYLKKAVKWLIRKWAPRFGTDYLLMLYTYLSAKCKEFGQSESKRKPH